MFTTNLDIRHSAAMDDLAVAILGSRRIGLSTIESAGDAFSGSSDALLTGTQDHSSFFVHQNSDRHRLLQ